MIDIAIAGGQRRVLHVQGLAVVLEQLRFQFNLIHPEVTGD